MTREGHISYETFVEKFIDQLAALINNEKGAQLLGAILDPATIQKIEKLEKQNGHILFKSAPYRHPEYKNARTLSPMIMELDPSQKEYTRMNISDLWDFSSKQKIRSIHLNWLQKQRIKKARFSAACLLPMKNSRKW
jgi:hypothetical protein